ncbi:sulfite oxidase [Nocardia stercoris]|nr:sulfite oxidase [Nocardia stercoris]
MRWATGRTAPELSAPEAMRQAVAAGLIVLRADPLNAETPLSALTGRTTPNALFYQRNHFRIPVLDPNRWRLRIGGLVAHPSEWTLADLRRMPSRTTTVTLECAGNGRTALEPPAPGEQWGLGAVGTADWTGVPLLEVLARAGLADDARAVVFRGADRGPVEGQAGLVRYERSLEVDEACRSGALLAYAMNGEPLSAPHGAPLRLVVPGWYGMAAVKWLTGIVVADHAFTGFFQTTKYVYEWPGEPQPVTEPVRLQRVRAVITDPASGGVVRCGPVTVHGVAWSGRAPVTQVVVQLGHRSPRPARLSGDPSRGGWREWELTTTIDEPGPTALRARAVDAAGDAQPWTPHWNRLGYGVNAVQVVPIRAIR